MKKFLCWIGIHRPLIIEDSTFIDKVTGKIVFHARCNCNIKWLTDNFNGWKGFRVRRMTKYDKRTWVAERYL